MGRHGGRLATRVGFVLAAIALLRLSLVAGVGLGDDEAYYWTWSRQLDWSYFDHPGGIAWLIALSTHLFGDTPLGVRLPVVMSSALLSALLGWMCRSGGLRGVWLGALLGAFVPALGLMAVFSSPDLPMLVAWLAAVALAEGLGPRTTGRWTLAGAAVGATLLFKLTGVLLAVGLVGWTLACPTRRRWWTHRGPWLAVTAAGLVSAPTWAWNLVHDFPTLRFHAIGRHTHAPGLLQGAGLWLLAHLVLLLPTVAWAVTRSAPSARRSLLVWAATPTWLVFTVATLFTSAKPHWWTPAWLTVLPLAVEWLAPRRSHALRVVTVAGLLHLGVVVFARFTPGPLLPATAELRGWDALASELSEGPPSTWLTPRYQASAQLQWATRNSVPQTILRVSGRADQFTLWQRDRVPTSGSVLLICPSHLPCQPADIDGLSCPQEPQRPATHDGGQVVRTFDVWTCQPSR